MKTKLNGILTLLLALVVQVAFAQQTVTGKVTDISGEGMLGATVLVKGTSSATTTDFDGNYTILAKTEDVLVFSSTGMVNQEIVVGNQTTINVTLEADALEEVVVVGYKTVNKKKSTIASVTITSESIEDRPNASFVQRLQGQISGLNIQSGTGQPGANSTIELRGPSSINGNTEPLIILDGVPINEDDFTTINPNDFETVTVLKDAGATAIYGNRGANGVIVVTTKKGKYGTPLRVSYNASSGFATLIENDYNLYNSRDYLRLENRENTGLGATLTDAEIDNFAVDTKWSDVFFRTGVTNSHNLSFTQGGKNTTTFTALNFFEQEGALQASDLKRINLRSNISGKNDSDTFRYSTSLTLGHSVSNSPGAIGAGALFGNYILGAFQSLPYLDPADYDNSLLTDPAAETFQNTPFLLLDGLRFVGNTIKDYKIVLGGQASYDITEKLTASYQIGTDFNITEQLTYRDPRGALEVNDGTAGQAAGEQSEFYTRDFRFNSNASLTYSTNLDEAGDHSITGSAYLEYVKSHLKSFNFQQNGLDPRTFAPGDGSGFIADNNNDDVNVPTVGSGLNEVGLFSYFGNVDYDYKGKFGFGAVLRRDASSRFTDENKWGTFYAFSGRWNIDQEKFMENSVVNSLKVRASYGEVGNDRILGTYYGALSNTRSLFATGLGYGDNQTFVPATFGNRDLKWETVITSNFGIDFGVWNNRLRGSFEVYEKKTEDLFFSTLLSATTGAGFTQTANSGDLKNTGVELQASYDVIQAKKRGDLSLTVSTTLGYNENEVTKVNIEGGLQDNGNTVIAEGHSINEIYAIPYIGVNPANGNLLFLDIDGNVTENPDDTDRRFTGKDALPDLQGSLGFSVTYKNFFFENQWNFITGIDTFDFDLSTFNSPAFVGRLNLSTDLERAWQQPGDITDVPSFAASNTGVANTDRFVREADFLRLRFAQLGYNFPQEILDKVFLTNGRIYVSGENLLTFSKWRGADPERPDGATQFDYPQSRIFTVGLDLTF